jgi:hypothetical protein
LKTLGVVELVEMNELLFKLKATTSRVEKTTRRFWDGNPPSG